MTTKTKKAELASLWYYVCLQRSHSTEGEWQRHPNSHSASEGYADAADLTADVEGDIYEIGVDDLPADCPIAIGAIHNCPQRVFAVRGEEGEWTCFGLEAIDTWCDAETGEAIAIADSYAADDRLDGYERI